MGRMFGFVGWPGAGKDEAADYLQSRYGARRFGHSDFIRTLAAKQGNLEPKPEDLSAIFEAQAAVEGYGWIARQVAASVKELWEKKPETLVVVSGVRNLAEVDEYRELSGFQLVRLKADFEVRFQRCYQRRKIGEMDLTRSRFEVLERLPGNANIPPLMELPGPVITNNGQNRLDFHRALDRLVHGISD